MREGIDIYSFDLKMVVFRSMVRDKVWFLTFLTEGIHRCMCRNKARIFLFFEETMCKFPVVLPLNRIGIRNILVKKMGLFHSMA